MNFLDNFIDIMKFENVIMLKILSDVLKRIYLGGKFLFEKGLLSLKFWLVNMNLMVFIICYEFIFNLDFFMYFGIFIDDNNVVILNESNKFLEVYDILCEDGKLVFMYECESILYDLCYVYVMNRIYVVFGYFVVYYEIKYKGIEFIEVEKI